MNFLVLNSGSSSLKFTLFSTHDLKRLFSGMATEIGSEYAEFSIDGRHVALKENSHHGALQQLVAYMKQSGFLEIALYGVGHRVVHGGALFSEATLIDHQVIKAIEDTASLAPLHNPANLEGIKIMYALMPDVPQIAVFDTAFHQSMPPFAYRYAVPQNWYTEHKVRRYGFHGTSHFHAAKTVAKTLNKSLDSLNMITLHLGNGASMTAIQAGKSVDTTMGMTPLEGLMMGTRSGDIDPAIIGYMSRMTGMSIAQIEEQLNRASGLKAVCGTSNMQAIEQNANDGMQQARDAIEMFVYRIKKYIGGYMAVLGHVDAIVFTGGIGEHSKMIRRLICEGLEGMQIHLDKMRNEMSRNFNEVERISARGIALFVIKSDEELEIAEQSMALIKQNS